MGPLLAMLTSCFYQKNAAPVIVRDVTRIFLCVLVKLQRSHRYFQHRELARSFRVSMCVQLIRDRISLLVGEC
jgi:hypothetical protein